MSYCVAQPNAVCLYVQILVFAQSADLLIRVCGGFSVLHCCIICCAPKLHSLLTGVKDNFNELLFSVDFGAFGFCRFFEGNWGGRFCLVGFFSFSLINN